MSESEKCDHPKLFTTCQDCGDIFFSKSFKMQNGWISVKDKLPGLEEKVLSINRFNEMHVCALEKRWEGEIEKFWVTDSMTFYPTHWMPLPEPPK